MRPAADPGHLDFLVASGHKMYAPFGAGVLIGPRAVFAHGTPDYTGGGTVEIVTEDDVYWAGPPDRDEAGSPNVVGAVAMAAACKALTEIGMDRLAEHEARLTAYALRELSQIEGVEIYGDADPARAAERLGVIPFNLRGVSHYLLAAILGAEYGIGVRNGCFCKHPYVLHLLDIPDPVAWSWRKQVVAGFRAHLPGLVRLSFGATIPRKKSIGYRRAAQDCPRGNHAATMQDPASGVPRDRFIPIERLLQDLGLQRRPDELSGQITGCSAARASRAVAGAAEQAAAVASAAKMPTRTLSMPNAGAAVSRCSPGQHDERAKPGGR